MYTVQYLSNMNGKIVKYNNQPIQVLKNITAASIRDNEVSKCFGVDTTTSTVTSTFINGGIHVHCMTWIILDGPLEK